jgi:serine/threonine-protein kinase
VTATALEELRAALVGRYWVERELGRGGMATVWLARDLRHDRRVALKVLHESVAASLGPDRFLQEIRVTARLNHPHILPLFDSGEAGGRLFYVMPLVEGESLRRHLERDGPLPLEEALRVTREVADALAYAHAHDVIHRDIKPENILLEGGHALVADFGIARALNAAGDARITQTGFSVGTPAYMSPEQASGEPEIDGRSDLYALACVLFEMLAGSPPFTGATAEAVLVQRFTQPPPRVSTRRAGVSAGIDAALHRAMARTPEERFPGVARFVEALSAPAPVAADPADKSIAVLPFTNLSADPENEYFCDGIAEEIINALTQLEGLRVAARTSAFSFKGKHEDLRSIGEKLNVSTVLEGSVRRAGSRIRITTQLISVADGYHLWSERYDRELTDVFAIQDDIATAIARKLRVTLAGREQQLVRPPTENLDAYDCYLKGRALLQKRGQAIREAVASLEQAVAKDPSFAAAHAALSEALAVLHLYGYVPPSAVMSRVQELSARALELAPGLAEAHDSVARARLFYDHDLAGAERAWLRALELNPAYHHARAGYAGWLLAMTRGQAEEAVAHLRRVVEGDPLSSFFAMYSSMTLAVARRYPEAIAEAERAIALDPGAYVGYWMLQNAAGWAGDLPRALAAAESALAMSGRHPWSLASLAVGYWRAGEREHAEAIYSELCARSRVSRVQPSSLAIAAGAAGRLDEGLVGLLQALDERDPFAVFCGATPHYDSLREHPRFDEALGRLGLA